MDFHAFKQQSQIIKDKENRIKCAFAAKRSGKSEACYVESIIKGNNQPGYVNNGRDPYAMAMIAPTQDMLTRLVWPKFRMFAKASEGHFTKRPDIFYFKKSNTILYGISAEKIERMEGLKLSHIHMTEAFQMKEYAFLEALARTSDTRGTITIDGSLGPQLINPKSHWLYRTFKESPFPGAKIWEWKTEDNPYFPKDELDTMRDALDPQTYRSMFEIEWDTIPINAVYADFSEDNIMDNYVYNPDLPTYVSIDWGWAHPMAVGFFQYDAKKDIVYLFDEIISSKLLLDNLYKQIMAKPYKISGYCCDISGNQEREQTGRSNIMFFKDKNIGFKYRKTVVQFGIPIVRRYIKNGKGQTKFYVSRNCAKSIDGLRQYRYAEKDGIILNENPVKLDDDACDMIRYFFVNFRDDRVSPSEIRMLPRR